MEYKCCKAIHTTRTERSNVFCCRDVCSEMRFQMNYLGYPTNSLANSTERAVRSFILQDGLTLIIGV